MGDHVKIALSLPPLAESTNTSSRLVTWCRLHTSRRVRSTNIADVDFRVEAMIIVVVSMSILVILTLTGLEDLRVGAVQWRSERPLFEEKILSGIILLENDGLHKQANRVIITIVTIPSTLGLFPRCQRHSAFPKVPV
ncbi:hypothetical protein CC2G_001525 [Coprinopsis cinerea AmutBmut pab1-1]|nr:hypothetical protein CC2G_004904 [Coprinopsis cinerea AmutBmut pab1-1]KAG2023922.1 hypothetical protein CC2G_001525 [Coprinopsis cinerea AmutBmut pab1-1]